MWKPCLLPLPTFSFSQFICYVIVQQKGTFETGQEDSTEIPEELKLRLAYREASVAILACYLPDPFRPFTEVIEEYAPGLYFVIKCWDIWQLCIWMYLLLQTDINSITSQPNMRYAETAGRIFARKSDYVNSIVRACARRLHESCSCLKISLLHTFMFSICFKTD